jgi:hypothetical protein
MTESTPYCSADWKSGVSPIGNRHSGRVLAALIFCAVAFAAFPSAAEGITCSVCDKGPLSGKIYTFQKTNYICQECATIETRCAICGTPVKLGFYKTTDGRYICRRDLPNAVVTQEEAQRLFEETRRQLRELFNGFLELKNPNVEVRLFDVDYWNSAGGDADATALHKTGFSASRPVGDSFVHNVILLSGKLKSDVAAACAHEYTHLWINENRPKARKIEQDTIEGVCELIAFKLASFQKDSALMQHIQKNPYTKGRILELLDLEPLIGLPAILDWIKLGTTETISRESYGFAAKSPAEQAPTMPRYAVAIPDRLVLGGIMKSGGKRTAMINRQRFETGEENNVRVGNKTVTVHCLEIQLNAVVITVDNSPERITLKLE